MTFTPQDVRSVAPAPLNPLSTPTAVGSTTPEGSPRSTPPSVHIKTLILDGLGAHSSAAIREGFRQAWEQAHDSDWQALPPDAFRGELDLHVHPGLSSREIGARLAQALIRHARQTPTASTHVPLA